MDVAQSQAAQGNRPFRDVVLPMFIAVWVIIIRVL
jgi:hypothetical protein